MYFRLSLTLTAFLLRLGDSVEFEFGAPSQMRVRIYRPEPPDGTDQVFCDAICERETSADLRRGFDALATDELPSDSTIPKERLEASVHQAEHFLEISPVSVMPSHLQQQLQQYVRRVHDDLWAYARRTVSILRWRYNTIGAHSPYGFKGFSWSDDQIAWRLMSLSGRVSISTALGFPAPSETTRSEVVRLINEGTAEPLGHELFREAWEQRHQNPRSALVIGIAALETGTKQCIAFLDPEGPKFAQGTQGKWSPPVKVLLTQHLPKLNGKTSGVSIIPLPKHLSRMLTSGVELRNQVVHGRGPNFNHEQLEAILLCIKDILYMLDYFCGYEWALRHLSSETRDSLIRAV